MDLRTLSILSPLLPILAFCTIRFNWKQRLKWVIFVLCLISLIVDLICDYLSKKMIPSIWIINVFTFLEAILLFLFFYLFFKKRKLKRLVLALSLAFIFFWIGKNLIINDILVYDYYSQTFEFIFLFLLCLIFLFQKANVTDIIFVYSYYEFWIVSALLIYCAGTFFSFFTPMNTIQNSLDIKLFEEITRLSSILKHALITVAFCMNNKSISNNLINPNSIYYMNDLKD